MGIRGSRCDGILNKKKEICGSKMIGKVNSNKFWCVIVLFRVGVFCLVGIIGWICWW